ncbi:MAG TPA: CocE/NonD family hydrolase [Solirubrobacteraceae bacterium]|nr:CocE/NonD family hydrolase [Solirubrobacteraceae bacterium]
MTRKLAFVAAALTATLIASASPAAHAAVPEGATWSTAKIQEADGTKLNATVFRPSNLSADAKTPVIISVGPYFSRSGDVGAAGPVQGAPYDPIQPEVPSRFTDLIEGADLMEKGYTVVYVDLRGYGGSTGCQDWGGPGEQADVAAAIAWASEQPWSTGDVGMYGKSYDGLTGLIGVAQNPPELKAVVSQEPVYDLYRYLYSNGVRYANSVGTPALYDLIAATPGPLATDPEYVVDSLNDLQRPGCPALNWLDQQNDNHADPYWQARDFIRKTKGSDVPVFLTQGFLENNTKPDGAFELFNGLTNPGNRAWFGMWDHVRGNDRDANGRLLMGREGWFGEVGRFFDHHLKGGPAPEDPKVVVQTSDGTWRAEEQWPPADARTYTTALRPGSYVDTTLNNGSGEGAGDGIWTFSPPLPHDAHLAGVPRVKVDAGGPLARANLAANVYFVAPDGTAMLLSRGTTLVGKGTTLDLELLGNDWKIPAGHRIGVLLSSSNAEWYLHVPTLTTVHVSRATIELPFLSRTRAAELPGGPAVRLEQWLEEAPFTVDPETIAAAEDPAFALPPAMAPAAGGTGTAGGETPAAPVSGAGGTSPVPAAATPTTAASSAKTATAKGKAKRAALRAALWERGSGRLVVTGNAPARTKVTVVLRRGGKKVASRRVTASRNGVFIAGFSVKRKGLYRATVTGASTKTRTRAVRLR